MPRRPKEDRDGERPPPRPDPAPAKRPRRRPLASAAPPVDYFSRTRHGPVNLIFLAPWLLVYLLCWWWAGSEIETQAAARLRIALGLLGRRGLFAATLCACLAACGVLLVRARTAKSDARVFPYMLVEGVVYGFLLYGASAALSFVLPVGRWLGLPGLYRGAAAGTQVRALGIAVGAGIFEELVFRGLLCFALFRTLRTVIGADRWSSGAIAVVTSALVFAAYHHWGPGGEPWNAAFFTLRFHAGVLLGVVFLTRGLGIAAFAHGFYDAIVLFG